MKKLAVLAALAGFTMAVAGPVFATGISVTGKAADERIIYGQEQCKEGEVWNEATQKCE